MNPQRVRVRGSETKNLALRKALVCILSLMLVGAAFGQQQADVQAANAYFDRGVAKGMKGALDGAFADFNRAIQIDPKLAIAYNNRWL